jgi:hypothetical protein
MKTGMCQQHCALSARRNVVAKAITTREAKEGEKTAFKV